MDYPDLSQPLNTDNSNYPDLSQPMDNSKGIQQFKDVINNSPRNILDNYAKNFTAGLANNLVGMINAFPKMSSAMPESIQNALPFPKNNNPLNNFDAYKAFDVQNKPITTPEGALQTAGELFLPGKAASEGYGLLKHTFGYETPSTVAKAVQASHDVLKNNASQLFDMVENEAKNRGINTIPINSKLIDEASQNLPNTRAVKNLLDKAKTGDYSYVRKLQSELGNRGTNRLSSDLASDRDIGEEMLDTREKINQSISNHFKDMGHDDLDNLLTEARSKYKQLKDTYYSHPTISKLVDESQRKIPRNIMNVFSEDSVPMQRLREQNPFIQRNLDARENTKNALDTLKKLFKGLTYAGGGIFGAHELTQLKNKFSRKE